MSLSSEAREEDRSQVQGVKHHCWKLSPGRVQVTQFSAPDYPAPGTCFMLWMLLDDVLFGTHTFDGMSDQNTWVWTKKEVVA